ncbi:MAG: SDR family oxidoreductase [Acidimicrobiia bacterium]
MSERPVALVTGSSRGMGRSIALALARAGCDIAVHYRRQAESAQLVAKEVTAAGVDALVMAGDLSDAGTPAALLGAVEERFGRLDILIGNAAATAFKPLADLTARHLDLTMHTVIQSFLLLAQGAVPLMAGRPGTMVAVSGFDSFLVVENHGLLGPAKAALEHLVRNLAVDLGPHDIAVNGVNPGLVVTDSSRMWAETSYPGGVAAMERVAAATPIGRMLDTTEIADVVAFLCSPAGRSIRGQTIQVDGGLTLRWTMP